MNLRKSEKLQSNREIFFSFRGLTPMKIHHVLEWAHARALRTDISYLDASKSFRRFHSDKKLEEVLDHMDRKTTPFFVVILRRNFNWFLILDNERHIEDLIEIGMRGIEIDSVEYFVHCYLKKELLNKLLKKFPWIYNPHRSPN